VSPPPIAGANGGLEVRLRTSHRAAGSPAFELEVAFGASPGVTVVVGHSGAGKSTILRCIAGLCDPEHGRVAVGGRVLFDSEGGLAVEPARRRVAFVFQDLALFPHLSVQDNVMYGLRRLAAAERRRRMAEVLESFQIAHLARRRPREISGGEQQRVALARALVTRPAVLLLDEPMSSLDPATKLRIIDDLQAWNRTRRIPILYVTHDHGEVLAMGDRVIVLERGRIVAEGLPTEVVAAPPRAALAQPAGFENLLDATVVEHREPEATMVCQLTGTALRLAAPLVAAPVGSEICLGIRASEILLSATRPAMVGECNVIPGRATALVHRGSVVETRVRGDAELRVRLDPRSVASSGLEVGAEVWMMIGRHACHPVRPELLDALRRLFVFVCHGNTVRSPMARAIFDAEIAWRFGVAGAEAGAGSTDPAGVRAVSAGLGARPGESLAAAAAEALAEIGVPYGDHRARNLTHRLAEGAEAIFCMSEELRGELAARFPAAAARTFRLDPDADLPDPHGDAPGPFRELALEIQRLVRRRLNGLGIYGVRVGLESA
jgi:molybdate transport system ATP-binding protein